VRGARRGIVVEVPVAAEAVTAEGAAAPAEGEAAAAPGAEAKPGAAPSGDAKGRRGPRGWQRGRCGRRSQAGCRRQGWRSGAWKSGGSRRRGQAGCGWKGARSREEVRPIWRPAGSIRSLSRSPFLLSHVPHASSPGLGNPGRTYANTRHNVGWVVIDAFARKHGLAWSSEPSFEASVSRWDSPAGARWLVKPLTFMNDSGFSVAAFARFHKLATADVCAIHDDLNIDLGRVKVSVAAAPAATTGLRA